MRAQPGNRPERFGDYDLLRLVGRGGMAEVYEARRVGPHGFNKRLALKRLHPALASDPRVVRMFCTEARVHAGLSHPNLVQVVDFGENDGELFMTMELVEGMNVAELLASVTARLRTIDLGPALHIAREVLRGLAHLHSVRDEAGRPLGLVHRDVAPGNVLIGRSGVVKLADFGIVLGAGFDRCTAPGELKGKIGYISPEQAMGAPLDGRSDVFSLGVVLAEMLIGQRLFPGRNELEILTSLHLGDLRRLDSYGAHIPPDVRAVLVRALARRPSDRFARADEALDAVEQAQRRHGVRLSEHALVEWLIDLGLFSVRSGVRAKVDPVAPVEVQITTQQPHAPTARSAPTVPDSPKAALALRRTDVDVSYRVRETRSRFAGPWSLAELLRQIAIGRVGLEAEVSRNRGPFLPLASMLELARLAARLPYRRLQRLEAPAPAPSVIRPGMVPGVLFQIAYQRRTGLLRFTDGARITHLYFVDGSPGYMVSTDESELLGAWLVAHGVLSQDALEAVLETGWRRGQALGEALVENGTLRPSDVDHALARQRMGRLRGLCRWSAGELCLVDQLESGCEGAAPTTPLPLIAEAVLEAHTLDQLTWILSAVRRSPVSLRVTPDSASRALGLPGPESEVLACADRAANVDALVRTLAASQAAKPQTTLRTVLLGLASGVLASDAWPQR